MAAEVAVAVQEPERANNSTNAAQVTPGRFIYVGPTLPGGLLKKNSILIGSKESVMKSLATVVEKYPAVKRLVIPVRELPAVKTALASGTNILRTAYKELSE